MNDPIKIIKDDHRQVEKLFKRYEALGDGALKTKYGLALRITGFLQVHAAMEERYFYPELEKRFDSDGDKHVEEAYAEHDVVKELIGEIEALTLDDPQFEAKLTVLKENITHHVKEEEHVLLPKAQKEFSKQELGRMGDDMKIFKEEKAK